MPIDSPEPLFASNFSGKPKTVSAVAEVRPAAVVDDAVDEDEAERDVAEEAAFPGEHAHSDTATTAAKIAEKNLFIDASIVCISKSHLGHFLEGDAESIGYRLSFSEGRLLRPAFQQGING